MHTYIRMYRIIHTRARAYIYTCAVTHERKEAACKHTSRIVICIYIYIYIYSTHTNASARVRTSARAHTLTHTHTHTQACTHIRDKRSCDLGSHRIKQGTVQVLTTMKASAMASETNSPEDKDGSSSASL